jgi:phage-related protein
MTAPVLPLTVACKITNNARKTRQDRNLRVQFGNGYSQIVADGINSVTDKWELEFAPLSGTVLSDMETFLSTVNTTVWFSWTPIAESVKKKWRIDENSIKKDILNFSEFVYKFSITQVFDLGT